MARSVETQLGALTLGKGSKAMPSWSLPGLLAEMGPSVPSPWLERWVTAWQLPRPACSWRDLPLHVP